MPVCIHFGAARRVPEQYSAAHCEPQAQHVRCHTQSHTLSVRVTAQLGEGYTSRSTQKRSIKIRYLAFVLQPLTAASDFKAQQVHTSRVGLHDACSYRTQYCPDIAAYLHCESRAWWSLCCTASIFAQHASRSPVHRAICSGAHVVRVKIS